MSKHYAEFRVGDLFEVVTGSIVKDLKEGYTPRINPTEQNNGIGSWTEGDNDLARYFEDFVSVSFLGNVFYQKQRSSLEMKVHGLKRKDERFGDRKGQYIASSVSKAVTGIYDYGMQLSSEKLKDLLITLPITDASVNSDSPEPDWEYMEEYIKSIEEKYLDSVEKYNRRNEDILDALHPDYHAGAPEAYDYAEFKVGELFDVNNLAYFDIKDVSEGEGKPLVSTRTTQNGYQFFSSEEEKKVHKGNVITLSAHSAQFFYQPIDFISVSHMYSISHEKMNRKIGMYLVSAFSKLTSKQFNFSQKLTGKRFSDMSVSLPVTSDGKPDWVFMEEYINFIEGGGEEKSQTTCSERGEHLEATNGEVREPELKEFRVEDLFEITTHALHNSSDFTIEGEIPYITRTTFNNGVAKYVDEAETKEIVSGNAITIAGETAKLYYQPYDFVVGTKVAVMRYETINRENAMYVISTIEKSVFSQFGFSNILTGKKLKELTITLPTTSSGDPDWEYMQSYIKEIDDQKKMQIKNYVEYKNRT